MCNNLQNVWKVNICLCEKSDFIFLNLEGGGVGVVKNNSGWWEVFDVKGARQGRSTLWHGAAPAAAGGDREEGGSCKCQTLFWRSIQCDFSLGITFCDSWNFCLNFQKVSSRPRVTFSAWWCFQAAATTLHFSVTICCKILWLLKSQMRQNSILKLFCVFQKRL